MNDDITAIRQSQMVLQELLQNMVEQIEEVVVKEAPIKESAMSALPKAHGWLMFEDQTFLRPKPGRFV